ncbi:MAG: hypothetical protein J6R04_05145 [Clostridia bacterium]|nr:hypothetical protein [Clostridia bacterium]
MTPGTVVGTGAVLGEVKYYEKDVVVANIIATDAPYNADPTGKTDATAAIQQALYDVDGKGGGVVFLPAGDYLITHTLFIPSGCVLQGDWQDPDEVEAGKAEYGTVILAKPEPLTKSQLDKRASSPLIMMDSYCGVVGLTFYYPEQSIEKPVAYGYTIYSESPRTAVLRDITMINSFRGVGVGTSLASGHELFQNESLHICALETGVEMYRSTEVGFTVDLTVSPKYWIEAGRGWACEDADALRSWCRNNTIGLIIQKLDDECLSTLRFDSCRTAIYMPRVDAKQQDFWGTLYDIKITDSMYGIVIEALCASVGAVIAGAEIEASEKAIVSSSSAGTLKLAGIKLTGKGKVHAEGGDIMYDEDTDLSEYAISYGEYQKPAPYLYNAEIKKKSNRTVDAAPAIQEVLDQAAATGGVVYLPSGVYSLYSPITVPEGVQLRGPIPLFTRDATGARPDGCLLISYVTDGAAINLKANAGVNGLRIFGATYDALTAMEALEANDPATETCVAIKGLGAGVYTYNISITGTMIGIDFTGCDNHLIKQTFGCCYNTFARVGGKNGVVTCCLNNPHFVNRQSFAKLGYLDEDLCDIARHQAYSHGQDEGTSKESGFATLRDKVLRKYCTMVEVVDADHQIISNIFMYAPYELVSVDNSIAFIYNTSADFVGFGSVYNVQNSSTVIAVNALRSVGDSVRCDESSYFDLYNRVNTEIYYEGDFHSYEGNVDSFEFDVKKKLNVGTESSMNGAGSVTLNTDNTYIKDGTYSYMHAPQSKTSETIITLAFNALNIKEYMNENGYLHMWVYAEDMGTQTWGGSIELTSSGKQDEQEIYWVTTSFITHNGWNELWLPLGDIKGGGGFNAEKVNFLRIQNTNNYFGNQGKFYIDDIYFCLAESDKIRQPIDTTPITKRTEPRPSSMDLTLKPEEKPEGTTTEQERIDIADCDSIVYPSDSVPQSPNFDPTYIKQGAASWRSDAGNRGNGMEIFCLNAGADGLIADISDYMGNGYLHFWLYVTDEEIFKEGQMELSSSGTFDKAEINWNPTQFSDLKKGWNEIILPLNKASKNSDFDPKKVNFIRLYIFTADSTYSTYYIDDIYFAREVVVVEDNEMVKLDIDNCDTPGVKTSLGIEMQPNYNPEYVKEGSGSYLSKGSERSNGNELFLFRGEWDLTDYMKNGALHAWIYFEHVENFQNIEFEITSYGDCDRQELHWTKESFKLQQGWNEIILPFSEASGIAADFDPANANFMRMFTISSSGTYGDYYIDDVYVYRYGNASDAGSSDAASGGTSAATKDDLILSNCDTTDLAGLGGIVVQTTDAKKVKEGTGAWRATDSSVAVFNINFDAPLDISAYENGYLHMWIWVESVANLKGYQFELTSSGSYDKNEKSWSGFIKNDGWNEIYLPLKDSDSTGGALDLAGLNYIRFYCHANEGSNIFYIDDMYFTNTKK